MKIIVDASGGDYAPRETVLGALDALAQKKSLYVVLVGDKAAIESVLAGQSYDVTRLEIVHAPEVITNDDAPTNAIREKKESSIVKSGLSQAIKKECLSMACFLRESSNGCLSMPGKQPLS